MWSERWEQTIVSLVSVAVGAIIYTLSLFKFDAIGKSDLESVPRLGEKVLPWLIKLRLISVKDKKGA
jgi:PST family polysaccharide transporter